MYTVYTVHCTVPEQMYTNTALLNNWSDHIGGTYGRRLAINGQPISNTIRYGLEHFQPVHEESRNIHWKNELIWSTASLSRLRNSKGPNLSPPKFHNHFISDTRCCHGMDMEQVFGLMNNLFEQNEETRQEEVDGEDLQSGAPIPEVRHTGVV